MLYPQFITKKRFTDAHAGQRAANPYWTRQVKSKKVYSIAPGNAKRQAKKDTNHSDSLWRLRHGCESPVPPKFPARTELRVPL
jgi:hypothetical protein